MNHLCGYVHLPKEIERIMRMQPNPIFFGSALGIQGTGKGKDVFLFEIERKLTGKVRAPHNQTIGDCVSQGVTGACEDLEFIQMAVDISFAFHPLSSEVIYGLARHQIGRDQCGSGDGAVVGWGVQAAKTYGVLPRAKYGKYDLTNYSGQIAKSFGAPRVGTPVELAEESKKYPIKEASSIQGPDFYSQAIDILANLGLIVTGSNQLYNDVRDVTGFCKPAGSGGHCTYYDGYTDNPKRPGIIYVQSWGLDMPTGGEKKITLPHGREVTLPPGHFFIDADNFNKMHARDVEVWCITSETGFSKPDIDIEFSFYN